ncbi:hypothetical protein MVEG_04099 [Podila verticillata NRRL 6337]|nr:hypothetical protein MVEG_04099 [Podila verticillata NRRL 6337]
MMDNHVSLFCLVDGEATPFSIKILSSDTIDDLKKAIKAEKTNELSDVDANMLTLWRVSVPVVPKKERKQISLVNVLSKEELDETDDISDVFDKMLPKKTIHIIVQRPLQGLTSEVDFLQCAPCAIIGEQQNRGPGMSSSHRACSLSPSPRSWDILESVRSMELDPTPQYERPRFVEDRKFRPESMLHDLFKHDFGSVNVLPPFADTTQIMKLRRGVPDLVCLRKNSDPDVPESVLFPIKIKSPAVLRSGNLVEDYEAQGRSGAAAGPGDSFRQAFGYMRLNGYRYGVLSTYEQTWFLKRGDQDADHDLMVSPTIAFNRSEPTLLQCYLWFGSCRTQSNSKETTRVILPAFDSMDLISHDEHAQTYKASWKGHDVVVKKCDIWNQGPVVEELKHEARVYQVLRTLQGRYIPELRIAGVADGMEMMLVTDFVGTDVSQEHLGDSDQEKIKAALSAIHDLGVIHGDIRPQNILVQHDGQNARFYFVDFGLSRITADKTELNWEMDVLDSSLRDMVVDWP